MASAVLGWIFVAASLAAFIAVLRAGWLRRYPCFCVLLLLQAWQGATVLLIPSPSVFDSLPLDSARPLLMDGVARPLPRIGLWGTEWWIAIWIPVERFRLLFAALATIEVLVRVTRQMEPVERWGVRFAALFPVIVIRLAERYYLEPWPAEPLARFLRLRVEIWVMLALTMLLLAVFLLLKPLPLPRELIWHGVLFMMLLLAHAIIAPLLRVTHLDWLKEQAVYRTIATVCCLGWVALATAPASSAAHRESR